MDRFIVITRHKVLDDWEKGELEDICEWDEQELNTDFTDWDWNPSEQVYEMNQLVDSEDCELDNDEYDLWKQGKFEAYRIHSRAEVYNLVRVTNRAEKS